MTFRVFTDPVLDLLNQIARGETRDVFLELDALQSLLQLDCVRQDYETKVFTLSTRGWIFVTCQRALALKRLKDASSDATGDSRIGPIFTRGGVKHF